ncbi:hypothetical protein GIB67_010043 [Kingdonia uniflora]|uniref:Uncharacterized protein n=1 Tax=Kingdonia uniflora TaxID=39325 RepID=A0A7J7KVA6_9MAGN|nr:hypothetical protein GIB67_010043 [Kingdonia uniflora]
MPVLRSPVVEEISQHDALMYIVTHIRASLSSSVVEEMEKEEEEVKEGFVLVARKGCFGLPTACSLCLPVYLYLRFANVDFDLRFNLVHPDSAERNMPSSSLLQGERQGDNTSRSSSSSSSSSGSGSSSSGDKALYDMVSPFLDIMYHGEVKVLPWGCWKWHCDETRGQHDYGKILRLHLSEKVGLDPKILVKVVSQGAISVPMFSLKGPSMVQSKYPTAFPLKLQSKYPTAFPLKHQQKDLKQPMAFLLSVVAETGLVSLPSLLTAVLLQVNTRLSSEQGSYVLPSNFEEAVTGVLKVLNNPALLDITLLQGMLVSQVLESRIEKMRSTYTLGVRAMKELNDTLQKKSSSNLEQIKSTFCAQTMAVENFLSTAVSEYEVIIRDIKNSLDEQKQLVTLSAQQQEEGLQRSLVSAQVISEATTDFFNDLCHHSSIFLTTIEQKYTESSLKLSAFEKIFQEQSTREEKLALEKIAAILRTLTSNKTYTVSKAMRNMDTENTEVKKMLEQEMVNIQNISVDARKEWKGYIEKVESQFVADTFSAADTKAAIESNLQEWDKCSGNQVAFENFVSVSSSTDAEFNSRTCDLLTTVNGFWKIMLLLWWSLYHLNTLPLFQLMYLLMCFGVTWIPVYF